MTMHLQEKGHEYRPRGDGFCHVCGGEGPKERARRHASLSVRNLAIAREADGANRVKFSTAATDMTFLMVETVRHGNQHDLSRELTSTRLGQTFGNAILRSAIASESNQLEVLRSLGQSIAAAFLHDHQRDAALAAVCSGLGVDR
tara:strand:+ start:6249 stop:6683 length:435 start_codon:yes stop_codon:yes gene_type:complete